MTTRSQQHRERQEIDFWAESPDEQPGADSLDAFTNKMSEARVVLEKFARFHDTFQSSGVVLEVGGGQCWVSCMIKRTFGPPVVIGSDIAPAGVASVRDWERVFQVELDGGLACRSYEMPIKDSSVDLIVVFAAAHHFGAHRRTLAELARVLRPGKQALYLHEPACRRYLHRLARWRVTRKRPVVPEDLLVYRRLVKLARSVGLHGDVLPAPTTAYRGAKETVYYYGLQKLPFLQRLLPCTIDLVLTKA